MTDIQVTTRIDVRGETTVVEDFGEPHLVDRDGDVRRDGAQDPSRPMISSQSVKVCAQNPVHQASFSRSSVC